MEYHKMLLRTIFSTKLKCKLHLSLSYVRTVHSNFQFYINYFEKEMLQLFTLYLRE